MSERELILHIGLGKCGTSSLQSFLAINGRKLSGLGYCYPELEPLDKARAGQVTSGNSAMLARSLLPETAFFHVPGKTAWIKDLESKIRLASARTVILSSEFFSMVREDQTSKLIAKLNEWGFRIRIVCYVRRQDHMGLANYIQGLIAGHEPVENSFEEEVVRVSKQFRYTRMLAPWAEVNGKTEFVLRVFDKSQLVKGDIISDFLSVLGISEERQSFTRPGMLNESLNAVSAYLIYLLRRENPENAVRRKPLEDAAMERFVSRLRTADWRESKSNAVLLGLERRRQILSFFEEDNRTVATRYARKPDGVLFEPLDESTGAEEGGVIPSLAAVLPLIIDSFFSARPLAGRHPNEHHNG